MPVTLSRLPGLEEYGNGSRPELEDDDNEFERKIAGLSEREKQRRRRLRSQRREFEQASRAAAEAETTSTEQLVRRATRATLRPVQRLAGEVGGEVGAGLGFAAEQAAGGLAPTPPRGAPYTPPARRRVKLQEPGRAVGKVAGEAFVPTTPEEVAIEVGGGPALGLAGRGVRRTLPIAKRAIQAARATEELPVLPKGTTRMMQRTALKEVGVRGAADQDEIARISKELIKEAKIPTPEQVEASRAAHGAAQFVTGSLEAEKERLAKQVAEATGQDIQGVRKTIRSASKTELNRLRRLATQLAKLSKSERGQTTPEVALTGGLGRLLEHKVPETAEQRRARIAPALEAVRRRIVEKTNLGESLDTADVDEYGRLLRESLGETNVPSQTLPPSQPSLELPGVGEGRKLRPRSLMEAGTPPEGPLPSPLTTEERVALVKAGREDLLQPLPSLTPEQAADLRAQRAAMRAEREAQIPVEAAKAKPADMTEDEYAKALEDVRGGLPPNKENYPPDWDIDRINRFRRLQQGVAGPPGGPPQQPPPPPKGPTQPGLPGMPQPRNKGSVAGEVWRSFLSIPGETIANVTALSPPILRQGRIRLLTAPDKAIRELMTSFRTAINDERFDLVDAAMKSSTWTRKTEGGAFNSGYTWEDLGGHILQKGDVPEEREIVANSWLGQKLRKIRGFSDRQAVMELNLHRTNWFEEVASQMWQTGERNVDEFRRLVRNIEHFTQRGSIGQPGNLPLFFSARAQSGRFQSLWDIATQVPSGLARGQLFRPAGEIVRGRVFQATPQAQAAKALVAMVGANMALMSGAVAVGGGAIEWRDGLPTWRQDKFHWNPWAGFGGPARLIFGIARDIKERFGDAFDEGGWESLPENLAEDIAERAVRYTRTQLSPVAGRVAAVATGEDFAGRYYNLGKDIKSGQLAVDLLVPFNIVTMVEAMREGGLGAAALAGTAATLSESIDVYQTLTEIRNDTAEQMGLPNYREATPEQQESIDQAQQVQKYMEENPSPYRVLRDRLEKDNDDVQKAARAEARWRLGSPLDKPLRDYWHDETVARRAIAEALAVEFKDMFEDFDKNKYEKALEEFYNIEKRDEHQNPDLDATESARQDWLQEQKPDVRRWIDEALNVSRRRKSPLHQEYLDVIDKKKAKGYFREGITGAEQEELDRQNPDLDVAGWRYNGGTLDNKGEPRAPALQTVEAVNKALLEGRPSHPVKLADVKRPVSFSEGSIAAWQQHAEDLEFYMNAGNDTVRNDVANKLAKGLNYNQLDEAGQKRVRDYIRNGMRNSPEIQAMLVWWGASSVKSVSNRRVANALDDLIDQYGDLLEED